MQFILVDNNQLLLGPMPWNRRMFESALLSDLDMVWSLPTQKDETPLDVAVGVRILKVETLPDPVFNPRTQGLHGPFFDYTDSTKAVGHYEVRDLPVDAVKNQMIAKVAEERYVHEISGTTAIIQDVEIQLDTKRGDRDIFAQALLLGSTGAQWKFPEGIWLTLSNAELQTIVQAIMSHVQAAFTWEKVKTAEIAAKVTLAELENIDLTYGN